MGIDLGLLHHPVYNRHGQVVTSAITNLDLHDIARAACTFGVGAFFVATPLDDQRRLAAEILAHWLTGPGAAANGLRRQALSLVRLRRDLAEVRAELVAARGAPPLVLATAAGPRPGPRFGYRQVREVLAAGESVLLLFGTGWGLAAQIDDQVDGFLPPIRGSGSYNHLSVRSAVAIVLDRLLGDDKDQEALARPWARP
ncbi:MAG: RNA methyltransferase [Thermodesulfobacteriota bacterium]